MVFLGFAIEIGNFPLAFFGGPPLDHAPTFDLQIPGEATGETAQDTIAARKKHKLLLVQEPYDPIDGNERTPPLIGPVKGTTKDIIVSALN